MIRTATLEDLPELLEMCRSMHKTTEFSVFPLSEQKVHSYLLNLLRDCFVVIAPKQGFFVGRVTPFWFSEALCAFDEIMYVYPDCRGRMLGARFVKLFETWAKEQGASSVTLGVTSGVASERTGEMYKRLGYRSLGGVYRKEYV